MNLGAALVQQGKDVLLIDEHGAAADSACALWADRSARHLADVAAGALTCERRSRARELWRQRAAGAARRAGRTRTRAAVQGGVILIDAVFDSEGRLSALAQMADELVLVLQPNAASITSAYAGIKRLHYAHGLKQLRFLVNGVAEPEAAQRSWPTSPTPAAATSRCRCSPPDGCAPIRTWRMPGA